MARRDEIPVGPDFHESWVALDGSARRRVRRAVNRGHALERRDEARLAVALARTQQRFWRWGWALGPLFVFVFTFLEGGWYVALVNTALVLVVVAILSVVFFRRARRAEAANLQVVSRGGKGGGRGTQTRG